MDAAVRSVDEAWMAVPGHYVIPPYQEDLAPRQWIARCVSCKRGIRCNSRAEAWRFLAAGGCATLEAPSVR